MSQPQGTQSGEGKAELVNSGLLAEGPPKSDAPKSDAPKSDAPKSDAPKSEVAKRDGGDEISSGDGGSTAPFSWVHASLFVIAGTSQLWFWNALLNWIFDVRDYKFPNRRALSDTLTAVNSVGNLTAACATVWRGGLSLKLCCGAGVLIIVASLGVCLLVQFGSDSAGTVAGLHLIVLAGGLGIGLVQSVEYAVSASMPRVYAAYVSIGSGICGILTFLIWLICSRGPYKNNPIPSVWWIMMVGAALQALTILAILSLARQPDVKQRLQQMRQIVRQERADPNAPSYFALFKKAYLYCLNVFFVFAVTLFVFPNIGPIRWGLTSKEVTILIGMFQIGDFIGRSIPSLASYVPFIAIKGATLTALNALRVIFIVIYVVAWRRPGKPWQDTAVGVVLLLSLAITNGYYGTCAMIEAPQTIPDARYRGKASSMSVVCLLIGINAGLWLARLVTYAVEGA